MVQERVETPAPVLAWVLVSGLVLVPVVESALALAWVLVSGLAWVLVLVSVVQEWVKPKQSISHWILDLP
jgi:hypothetical protein